MFIADILVSCKSVADKNDSCSVYIEHEENYYGKAMIYNKTSQVIKALQTELVYPNGCLHRYVQDDRVLEKTSVAWRPLPDIKFVSGPYPLDVLMHYGNYPQDILQLRPMAKYAGLQHQNFDRKKLCKKYGFSSNHQNILYASGGVKEDEEKLNELIRCVGARDNVRLYIKAHPSCDLALLKTICSRGDTTKVSIIVEGSIPELITICDLMVSVHSTVVMDAMVLRKPIMLINELEENMPFSSLTSIVTVKNLQNISHRLDECLSKDYAKVVDSYHGFISSYMGL